ncbi:MAG: SAM-dependent methyltransferase [Roseobacter sp.]
MTNHTQLTDTHALSLHRARATTDGMFLQESAAREVKDRLRLVNRAFTDVAIITPYPSFWKEHFPDARIVHDDATIDLKVGAHDLVIHALGLHWSNDLVGQLIQCRRSLRPDGLLIAALLGGQTLQELRRCLGQAEIELSGGLSPRIAPMAEIRDLGALLQRAGLALPVADSLTLPVEYRDAFHLMHDLRGMGETNAMTERQRHIPPKELFAKTNDLYADAFATDANRIAATFEMVFLTGWSPDPGQQKPLRPGSAKHRLAEALRVPEVPLSD